MRKPLGFIFAAVCIGIAIAGIASGCPADSIGGTGDMVRWHGFPALIIESCASEAGGVYTFTYRLTNIAGRDVSVCSLAVPGIGLFADASVGGELAWTGNRMSWVPVCISQST